MQKVQIMDIRQIWQCFSWTLVFWVKTFLSKHPVIDIYRTASSHIIACYVPKKSTLLYVLDYKAMLYYLHNKSRGIHDRLSELQLE